LDAVLLGLFNTSGPQHVPLSGVTGKVKLICGCGHLCTAGVALGMYNTEESIKGFASSCFEYALQKVGSGTS
jgi:hypothetical protein